MKRLNFKCTLLTDVVISAHTATEGEHQSLNFIPGSNFLGILASEIYKSNPGDCYSLFHSGKVRFGDAHIVYNDKRSFQVPFSWYYPKGGSLTENKNYMLNFMSNKNFKDLISKGIQLKQARDGYFTEEGIYLSTAKLYSQKSAHDSDKRRSAEGEMFGYEALQKGSIWQFCVDVDDDLITENKNILKELKALVGKKRLGRSKTAEFGTVEIVLIPDNNEGIQIKKIKPKQVQLEKKIVQNEEVTYMKTPFNLVFLYAESRLAFRDEETGHPTFTPTPEQLELPKEANILWDRSQIRTGVYAPWNWKRDCRDEDRVYIEKGSVIVVDFGKMELFTDEIIIKGVGLYKTEGFGKLRINPGFLDFYSETGKSTLQLEKKDPDELLDYICVIKEIPQDALLLKWFEQPNDLIILEMVDNFIKSHANKYDKVTGSQWGNIRSYADGAADKEGLFKVLFESPRDDFQGGFLTHGTELKQWEDGKELLEETIKATDDKLCLPFVLKLAARMQKTGGEK